MKPCRKRVSSRKRKKQYKPNTCCLLKQRVIFFNTPFLYFSLLYSFFSTLPLSDYVFFYLVTFFHTILLPPTSAGPPLIKLPFLFSCQLPVHILVCQSTVQMLSFLVTLSGTSFAFGDMMTLQRLNIFQLLFVYVFPHQIVNSLEETPLLRLLLYSCS